MFATIVLEVFISILGVALMVQVVELVLSPPRDEKGMSVLAFGGLGAGCFLALWDVSKLLFAICMVLCVVFAILWYFGYYRSRETIGGTITTKWIEQVDSTRFHHFFRYLKLDTGVQLWITIGMYKALAEGQEITAVIPRRTAGDESPIRPYNIIIW